MKENIIKLVAGILAMIALILIVGDLPDASLIHFAFVKIAGAALLWLAAKMIEAVIPEENI